MNTNKLKKFASKSRELLINEVTGKIKYLEVRDINKLPSYYQNGVHIDDVSFKEGKKYEQRKMLIERVAEIGEEQVIEEIAYLWFNRFIALRYMEVNNYLSYGSRVVSSDDKSKLEPDLIKNATHLIGLDLDNSIIYDFLDKSENDKLYKYLIIHICNSLHKELPFMFEKISDYSELLFPESLLEKGSFLDQLINEVDEEDWKEVEILGWLYQYYISDKKDIVFNEMKTKKKKISKENIPAATQLFTPKWIVKYMVQNSVGKTWLESHPNKELQSKWEYYIESESTTETNPNLKPEDITVLDPAMGSGHILVYAFEILFDIYKSAGYTEDEIPKLIIENNLYGLEIDDRAWQIACFAIMMKARKYDRKILKQGLEPRVCSIQESSECDKIDELIYPELSKLCIAFKQGKLLGSLITLKEFDLEKVNKEFEALQNENCIFNVKLIQRLPLIIKQAELIYKKYSCVVSNPPYMGARGMNEDLVKYLNKEYIDSKSDLFACFIERNLFFAKESGYTSMITMHSWMFLSSYEKIRERIVEDKSIISMIHLGSRAFKEIGGEVVQATAFTLKNEMNTEKEGTYVRLVDYKDADLKEREFFTGNYRYTQKQEDFSFISGTPIAYWMNENIKNIFGNNNSLDKVGTPKVGLSTGNNDKFIRNWNEVNYQNIGTKWYSYNKGGESNKWYGYNEFIVNWENNGFEIKNYKGSTIRNKDYYFLDSISTSTLTSNNPFRLYFSGIFDVNFRSYFIEDENIYFLLGFLNSKITGLLGSFLGETLALNVNDLNRLPIIFPKSQQIKDKIDALTKQNIDISKEEWDRRETSWDFSRNELLKHKTDNSLESAYNTYSEYWKEKFFTQHRNEEELNRLFIEIYGLQDEMTPEVELKDITLLKDETKIVDNKLVFQKDEIVKQFISYAVGCMMGRYSLDSEGLAFAGGDFDMSKYTSFKADDDGIIPVLSDEYFEDDIVARFKEFVKVAFGEESVNKNIDFIAHALTKKTSETSLERIRRYFATEFYKDHVGRYKKRPIYWMFTSGKDKTFNALVYLHRYEKGIISKIRMDYLHKLQGNLEGQRRQIESSLVGAEGKDSITLEKSKNEVLKKVDALKHYDEKLKHLAEQKIELDLDDGVKVNYPKLGDLLENIKL